jgi:hypothetical protein
MGGGAMTFVQYPYAVLSQLGNNLHDVSGKLTEKNRGAAACMGLGSNGQAKIQHSIDGFRGTWKQSVRELLEGVGKWGGLSGAIGDMVAQFDAQTAAALRPDSAGPVAP